MKKFVLLSALSASVTAEVCPDTTPASHYILPAKTYTSGLPAGGVTLGSSLTTCELYELQKYCVEAINVFRTGTVKFSDGRSPPFTAKTPIENPDTPLLQCLNEKALSDLVYAKAGAGCGHYTSSEQCNLGTGGGAENSCCPRSCSNLENCKATLDGCFRQMYDEGEIVLDTGSDAWTLQTGHYWNMIGNYKYAVCGFGFMEDGSMLATQNFFGNGATAQPCNYNCGTASSPADECGKCSGVSYCTNNGDCNDPPVCYDASGTCTSGICEYLTEANACVAGTCSAGVCTQTCADTNCAHCTDTIAGACDLCKSGYSLVGSCCVSDDCVIISGSFAGTYNKVAVSNGFPAYEGPNGRFLVMYCCGWGWSIANGYQGGAGVFSKSSITEGTAVESSGKWENSAIIIEACAGCDENEATRSPTSEAPTSGPPPTFAPSTRFPTREPTMKPTLGPSATPTTADPTKDPTMPPSPQPTADNSAAPSSPMSSNPTAPPPTLPPTFPPSIDVPTGEPTMTPTKVPTNVPTLQPTAAPDQCLDLDCGANGACVEGVCKCATDYYGNQCELYQPCQRVICENGGICNVVTVTCECNPLKFTGDFCEVVIPLPTCFDKIKNQNETDVDCGGVCKACPTCTDEILNQDETDIDCGGACPPCPTCFDNTTNQGEEAVDCGGSSPCASCSATPTCSDGTKNGDETGKDCGGSCPACITYAFRQTNWTECSKPCGGGIRTAIITCVVQGAGLDDAGVDKSLCIDQGLHPETNTLACNEDPCPTYTWATTDWEGCTQQCGGGIEVRTLTCVSSSGGTVSPPEDFCSTTTKPADAQICNTQACIPDVKFWVTGLWTDCSAFCGGGTRTRTLRCQNGTAKDFDLSECDAAAKPATEEDCNVQECAAPSWTYCAWETCTAMCAGGVDGGAMGGTMAGIQNRRAICQDESTGQSLDPSLCANLAKSSTTKIGCNPQACTDYNWMTTLWGPCVSVNNTDTGIRERTAHCHAPDGANELVKFCDDFIPEKKPPLSESCFLTKCPANGPEDATTTDGPDGPDDVTAAATMPIASLAFFVSAAALLV